MTGRKLWMLLFAAKLAIACKCSPMLTACNEAGQSDRVFIGVVESVTPRFFDQWNPDQMSSLRILNQGMEKARANPSAPNLEAMRSAYLRLFPDASANLRKQITEAKTPADLVRAFVGLVNQGRMVHLKVKATFPKAKDSGDPAPQKAVEDKKSDDDDKPAYLDVWTAFDDCGVDFQVGETYLVYADDDEESGFISTSSCTRTRRLTEAGDDLAYLFFLKDDEHASQLEGFVTSNVYFEKETGRYQQVQGVAGGAAGAVVELRGDKGVRYGLSDASGRFVFDGLPAGKYSVTAYAPGYPRKVQPLAQPKDVKLQDRSCSRVVLYTQ